MYVGIGKNTNHNTVNTTVVIPHRMFYCMKLSLSVITYLYVHMYTHVSSFQFQLLAIDNENLLQSIVCLMWDCLCISITMDVHSNLKSKLIQMQPTVE